MATSKMTNKELIQQIQRYGETPPTRWTKAELLQRLSELQGIHGEQEHVLKIRGKTELKAMISRLNKAKKRRSDLVKFMAEDLSLTATPNETIDQLTVKSMSAIYQQVAATSEDLVGFGRHSAMTYGQLINQAPSYATWVQKTAQEADDPDPRLLRLAAWLDRAKDTESKPVIPTKTTKGYHLDEPVPEPGEMTVDYGPSASTSRDASRVDAAAMQTQVLQQLMETVKDLKEEIQDLRQEKPRKKEAVQKTSS
eukprot:s1474_g5.t1